MGADGAEGASSEASAVYVDGEFYHLVCRNPLVLVFRMWQSGIWQVVNGVKLSALHWRVRRVHHYVSAAQLLYYPIGVHHVRLLLNHSEVLCLRLFVLQAFLVGVYHDVILCYSSVYSVLGGDVDGLWNFLDVVYAPAFGELAAKFGHGLLAHAIYNKVSPRVFQYAGHELVLPVVVVCEPSERSLYTPEHDGRVGVELAQYAAVYNGGVFGTAVVPSVGTVCVFRPQSLVCGVFVNHGVHAAGRYSEEESRFAQFLEVTVVAVPVWLWHDGHSQSLSLKYPSDYCSSEGRMVHVCIGGEQDNVEFIPSSQFHFLLRGR